MELIETAIRDSFAEAVRAGLSNRPRSLPPRFFYDARGSELFDRICEQPEYYLTRTEASILSRHASELPAADTVIEFGCGSAAKTKIVLDAHPPKLFVPVDISRSAIEAAARRLSCPIRGIVAEFENAYALLPPPPALVLFLGSNIGNFNMDEAGRFLGALRGYTVLVGFDLQKDPAILHAAYNDAAGVTAQFNLNLLARINRELGGTFDLAAFEHRAFYNAAEGRVEMHLVSRRAQTVRIGDWSVSFEAGESIHTENSYKFTDAQIERLARESGFRVGRVWKDPREWFAVAQFE